jgi:hypothetical protein
LNWKKIRDEVKNNYCEKHNIKLLRISYLEDNIELKIETILDEA